MKTVIFGGDNTAPSISALEYNHIHATFPSSWNATQTSRNGVVPVAFDLNNLFVELGTAPGSTKSRTFTVMKNGVATALAVTISDTATTGNNTADAVSFVAGDTISIQSDPGPAFPAATDNVFWTMECESNAAKFPIIGGSATAPNATSYNHVHSGMGSWATTETDFRQVVPIAGTLRDLKVRLNNAPGAGDSWAVTLVKNGVDTGLTVTIADTATTGDDNVNTVSIAAGDEIVLKVVETGIANSPGVFAWGLVMEPTTNGESFFAFGSTDNPATGEFNQVLALGNTTWITNEALRLLIFSGATVKSIYAELGNAPGTGTSRTFTLRKEQVDTALTVTIADTATTGNFATDVTFTAGDQITFGHTLSGAAAAAGRVSLGVAIFYQPAGAPAAAVVPNLLLMGVG